MTVTSHGLLAQVRAFEPSFISGIFFADTVRGANLGKGKRFLFYKNFLPCQVHRGGWGVAPLVLKLDITAGDYRQSDMVKTG